MPDYDARDSVFGLQRSELGDGPRDLAGHLAYGQPIFGGRAAAFTATIRREQVADRREQVADSRSALRCARQASLTRR
jgi:hypothetical protein